MTYLLGRFGNFLKKLFQRRRHVKLGLYGPPNGGKTTLANRICKDWTGEELGIVSPIAHETREIQIKEEITIQYEGKELTVSLADTPGIATKIDYEDFLRFGIKSKDAKQRAREATKGIIESIKWLDNMDAVIVVLDSTHDPYNQVNLTLIGNLEARKIPMLLVANKIDLKRNKLRKIQTAFPQYQVVGISAKSGKNMDQFYKNLFEVTS
ncbi:MAG TPA: Era-like GTP-binding protein [Candidatus Nanoarchaeia archaeon]|nr:Era-like GTP-binding protein [Candidatus Nanoarchaeia archaeon]